MRRSFCLAAWMGMPLLAAAAGCTPQPKATLNVVGAHATLPAVADRPAGVFFTITGGAEDVALLAVTSPMVRRAEMHDTVMTEDGLMAMKQVTSVPIPARSQVAFKHGGKHVMIWNVNPKAVAAGTLPMTFIFSNSDRILADVRLDPPLQGGQAPPAKPREAEQGAGLGESDPENARRALEAARKAGVTPEAAPPR